MIENYFIKHSKRKNQEENDQPLEGQARKIPKKDPLPSLLKEPPLDLTGDKPPTQLDIFTVLKNLPELKWRKITAENLNLEYAIMFTKNQAYKIFNYLENELFTNITVKCRFLENGIMYRESKPRMGTMV